MPLQRIGGFALGLILLVATGCGQGTHDEPDLMDGRVVIGDRAGNPWGDDAYDLNSVSITGDTLSVTVSYGGGCRDHAFTLVAADAFMESDPVQLRAFLAHNANGDRCEAYLTTTRAFDLTPIRTRYQEAYQQDAGAVVLLLEDAPGGALVYEFAP